MLSALARVHQGYAAVNSVFAHVTHDQAQEMHQSNQGGVAKPSHSRG